MKLPVVSGSEAVKAFGKADTNSTSSTAATSCFDIASRRTGASPFPTTKNLPKGLSEH